jgi:signal peptidase II
VVTQVPRLGRGCGSSSVIENPPPPLYLLPPSQLPGFAFAGRSSRIGNEMEQIPTQNLRSPVALLCFFLTAVLGLGLDLWTKNIAFDRLLISMHETDDGIVIPLSRTHQFIPGWLHFHVTANQGAVFGKAQGFRWLFVIASIGAIAFLLYQFVLGLLLAGVLGNLYDRARFGYVRDMIYALPDRTWPGTERELFPWIFNLADSYLCVGVFLMIVYMYLHKHERTPRDASAAAPI